MHSHAAGLMRTGGAEPSRILPRRTAPRGGAAAAVLHLQRTAGNAAVAAMLTPVQRHQNVDTFSEKGRLESAELRTVAELQAAASSAARALEVGKSSGPAVARLQDVLRSTGYPDAPASASFDPATQAVLKRFQADHGIPFPTGRQAGPKTLSTLDDHLTRRGGGDDDKKAVEVPIRFGTDVKKATQDREGKLKEKPEGPPSIAASKTLPAEEKDDGILQGKFQVNYGALWKVQPLRKADGTTDSGGFGELCENGGLQGTLTLNVGGVRLGERWRILGSYEVSVNLAPLGCHPGKVPAVEAQVEVLKLEMTKWAELALLGMVGVEGGPLNSPLKGAGVLTGAGLEVEVKPFRKVPALKNWSIVGSANASYLWQAAGPADPAGKTPQLGGTIGLGATWDIIPAPKK